MGLVRSRIAKALRWVLARRGFLLVKPRFTFGFDVWCDIHHLAEAWTYPVAVVFDVGAHDGETALSVLRAFPEARVTSFEPHPETFAALTRKLSRHPRFEAVNTALGVESGEVMMFQYEKSNINSLTPQAPFAVRFAEDARRIVVSCATLDDHCARHAIARIDLLKIDTEGFDLVVLQGAQKMLRRRAIRFILVEFNDLQPRAGTFGGALAPIDTLLRPHGYRFVASYVDYIVPEGEMFFVSNALFALPPPAATAS